MGGLGNQMFQYAFGKNTSIKYGFELKFETYLYKKDRFKRFLKNIIKIIIAIFAKKGIIKKIEEIRQNKRQYDLKYFELDDKIKKIKKSHLPIIEERTEFCFDPELAKDKDNLSYLGYFNNEKYFSEISDIIRNDFKLKKRYTDLLPQELIKKINESVSVSVHIRRGDYINTKGINQYHGTCDIAYYQRATNFLKDKLLNPIFFIFSDDINWCKNNLQLESETIFISGLKNYEDLTLMSKCKHNIIANSTFSWWGAWLNPFPNKIVIAPKKWLNNPEIDTSTIIPDNWIKL